MVSTLRPDYPQSVSLAGKERWLSRLPQFFWSVVDNDLSILNQLTLAIDQKLPST
jgi:hypothetical protein